MTRFGILMALSFFLLSCRAGLEPHQPGSQVLSSQVPRSQYLEDHADARIRELGHTAVGIGLRMGETFEPYTAGRPFCSGMIFHYQGFKFVLTAAHCVKEAGLAKIDIMPFFSRANPVAEQNHSIPLKTAIFVDHRLDLALLGADLPEELEGWPLAMKEAVMGLGVLGIGHPAGDFKKVFDHCEVTSVGVPFIFAHDCRTVLGSSGSAILDQNDFSLIGVVSSGSGGATEDSSSGSRIAVHTFPLSLIIQGGLEAESLLGYTLDSGDGGYHFLAFNGQVHCPRNSGPICRQEMEQITAYLGKPENRAMLEKHFPVDWKAFDAFQTLGFLVRLRKAGEHKVNGNVIDYVYSDPERSFAKLFKQWADKISFP